MINFSYNKRPSKQLHVSLEKTQDIMDFSESPCTLRLDQKNQQIQVPGRITGIHPSLILHPTSYNWRTNWSKTLTIKSVSPFILKWNTTIVVHLETGYASQCLIFSKRGLTDKLEITIEKDTEEDIGTS